MQDLEKVVSGYASIAAKEGWTPNFILVLCYNTNIEE